MMLKKIKRYRIIEIKDNSKLFLVFVKYRTVCCFGDHVKLVRTEFSYYANTHTLGYNIISFVPCIGFGYLSIQSYNGSIYSGRV